MPPKQRQVRQEQKSQLAAMQQMEHRTDEELEMETRFRAAAQAILGARAAERYNATKAREHFRKAIAAARPQERMQLRRMAEASLALAERRPDALKASMEKLGAEAPSSRQLFFLRLAGLLAPPASAGTGARVRGTLLIILLIVAFFAICFGIGLAILAPFGSASVVNGIGMGVTIAIIALVGLFMWGRRKQRLAKEKAQAAG